MSLRAALFDVGGTLLENGAAQEDAWRDVVLARIREAFGAAPWAEPLYCADDLRQSRPDDPYRQETNRWLAEWLRKRGEHPSDADVERLRQAFAAPLPLAYELTEGAAEAVRWCKAHGMAVVLVTNTTSSADADVRRWWDRFGLSAEIDAVVTSYSTGWAKPHPAMFRRALTLAGAEAAEACMVGDRLDLDIAGAKVLGIRAVWRSSNEPPQDAQLGPDAVIGSLAELPRVLEAWALDDR